MAGKLYFAYGSNINMEQMAYRCPDAQVVGPAFLPNYVLRFRGNNSGRGVATIVRCQDTGVWGILWRVTPQCELALDKYEGVPIVYSRQSVIVRDEAGNRHRVMTYAMTNERTRRPMFPSWTYYDTIRRGYLQNGLPLRPLDQALARTRNEVREWGHRSHPGRPAKKKEGRSHER